MRCACACLLLAVSAYPPIGAEPVPPDWPLSPDMAKAHQQAWAAHLGLPVRVTNSLGMELSLIPPGQFVMGSPPDEEWHRPDEIQHRVTLTKPFCMGATEVTQGQWMALMDENPAFCEGDELPVDTVTWEQAAEFCRKLSEKEGVRYRLATEAQWEYAARAGTTTPFHTGDTIRPDQANYDGNRTYAGGPKGPFRETSTAAGHFAPNPWGIHDMHGNRRLAKLTCVCQDRVTHIECPSPDPPVDVRQTAVPGQRRMLQCPKGHRFRRIPA